MRIEAEKKRDELESKLIEFEKQIKQSHDALVRKFYFSYSKNKF